MKKVLSYHDNFEYYQPNSHSCGDCALRAVSKAMSMPWFATFDALVPIAREMQRMPNDTKVIAKFLESKGFKWHAIEPVRGGSRPTVSEFAKGNKKNCVLRVAHHLTSSSNGKYYDIWDCGERSLYGYWEKE